MLIEAIVCDICGYELQHRFHASQPPFGKTYMIKSARERGWSIGKSIKCPVCKRLILEYEIEKSAEADEATSAE